MEEIPRCVAEAARAARNDLIPEKSRERYYNCYRKFKNWQEENNVRENYSEDVMLAYLKCLLDKNLCSTVWAIHSMIKAVLKSEEGVDIGDYKSLQPYLKTKSKNHKPKQAKVFNDHEIQKFLDLAPDEIYLAMKAVVIVGVLGALRCQEIADLCIENLKDLNGVFLVNIPDCNKTLIQRNFTISDDYYRIIKKYLDLRPDVTTRRVFLNYRNGRCYKQHIGKNSIAKIPSLVATYLGLSDIKLYTGHSFRRTSATLLANGGGDLVAIKRQGGWKSSACAERYLEESIYTKKKNESLITNMLRKSSDRGVGKGNVVRCFSGIDLNINENIVHNEGDVIMSPVSEKSKSDLNKENLIKKKNETVTTNLLRELDRGVGRTNMEECFDVDSGGLDLIRNESFMHDQHDVTPGKKVGFKRSLNVLKEPCNIGEVKKFKKFTNLDFDPGLERIVVCDESLCSKGSVENRNASGKVYCPDSDSDWDEIFITPVPKETSCEDSCFDLDDMKGEKNGGLGESVSKEQKMVVVSPDSDSDDWDDIFITPVPKEASCDFGENIKEGKNGNDENERKCSSNQQRIVRIINCRDVTLCFQ